MDCIKNIIGINHCRYPYTYVKDISQQPGIGIKSLDHLADDEQITFLNVLEDIKQRGIDRLNALLIENGLILNSNNFTNCFGIYNDNNISNQTTSSNNGIIISLKKAKYLVLYLKEIIFFTDVASQTIDFIVKDTFLNNIILQKSIVTIQGKNIINLNLEINPNDINGNVFIGFDQTNISFLETKNEYCYNFFTNTYSCECDPCTYFLKCKDIVDSKTTDTNNLSTFGMSLYYSINCSMEKMICDNSSVFSLPLLYATSIEFIYERLVSDRLNYITLLRDDNYEKLLINYENLLSKTIKGIFKTFTFNDNCCFACHNNSYVSIAKI